MKVQLNIVPDFRRARNFWTVDFLKKIEERLAIIRLSGNFFFGLLHQFFATIVLKTNTGGHKERAVIGTQVFLRGCRF